MKRIVLFLLVTLSFSVSAYGEPELMNKRVMADSLTAFCARKATVGKIKITTIRVKDDSIVEIYASKQLGTVPYSPEDVQNLYQVMSELTLGNPDGHVSIYCEDKRHEISRLVTSFRRGDQPDKKDKIHKPNKNNKWVKNESLPYSVEAGLEGEHIALWGSHGIYFNQKEERWLWQRAKLLTTVEDLYTTGYTMPFLVPMLENAGAVVIQPRERDTQLSEVVVDDSEALNGDEAFEVVTSGGWGRKDVLLEGENPFRMGGYLRGTNGAVTYTPELPEAGEYAVYVSYKTEPNSTKKALYTVCHRGVETVFTVNQRMGGSMWVYLGTFDFSTDKEQNYVRVEGPNGHNELVTTDAVRFGGGWGNVARYALPEPEENIPSAKLNQTKRAQKAKDLAQKQAEEAARATACVSGYPRWIEGARYWMQYSGVPDSIYNYTNSKNDYTDDYASRGQWVNWLAGGSRSNPQAVGQHIPVSLSLAFHTDAGNIKKDSIVGTLSIYTDFDNDKDTIYPTGASRSQARDFADYLQTQIVEDIRALYAPEWTRRMLQNSSYSEARVPKVPGVLLELLSHQNFADMRYGLDPRFRFSVSRAIYKSMLRFLHEQSGAPFVVQPLPIKDFASRLIGNTVELSWAPVSDPLEPTAEPTYYIVYTRADEGDWDNGVQVEANTFTLPVEKGKRYDFKVVAGNAGGISFPSEVLSAYRAPEEKGTALIVNGFTRVGAPEMLTNTDEMAGFQTESFPVSYKKDVIYIGAEYDFCKANPWTSDDDQGFGACYADKAKETEAGNMFDYPVMHGKALQTLGFSYVSCAASTVDSARLAGYDVVDLIFGKQKETTLGVQQQIRDFKTFTPALQEALKAYHGSLLCSGAYIGTDMRSKADTAFTRGVLHYEYRTHHATHSGKIVSTLAGRPLKSTLVMEQNPDILPTENPDAIRPSGDKARAVARYDDSGLCAGVAYEDEEKKQLVFSFPIESLHDFEPLYTAAIRWLTNQ